MSDIIIADQEFIDEGTNSAGRAKSFETTLETNIEALNAAVIDWQGVTATKFNILINQFNSMKGKMESLAEEEKKLIEQFIIEIDEADKYLYD